MMATLQTVSAGGVEKLYVGPEFEAFALVRVEYRPYRAMSVLEPGGCGTGSSAGAGKPTVIYSVRCWYLSYLHSERDRP